MGDVSKTIVATLAVLAAASAFAGCGGSTPSAAEMKTVSASELALGKAILDEEGEASLMVRTRDYLATLREVDPADADDRLTRMASHLESFGCERCADLLDAAH